MAQDTAGKPLVLNGRSIVSAVRTLADLMAEQGFSGKVATAVNEEFVPEKARPALELRAGDRVEVVSARQGG